MTNIYLHGILGKKFGKFFKGSIDSIFSALKLIDANKNNFLIELRKMYSNNFNYIIICDGCLIKNENEFIEKRKINNIYILPDISGSGNFLAAAIMGIAVEAVKESLMATILAAVINVAIGAAVSLGVSYIMDATAQNPAPASPADMAVGGQSAAIEARGRSYIFSNDQNLSSQGNSIPVGYGYFHVSSLVVGASIKTFETSVNSKTEFQSFKDSSIFFENLTK